MTGNRRIRWAVRGTLILGVAASVAANVLHARDNPISQAIAAWPPLALLITVEVVARVPIIRHWLGMVRVLGVTVIAGIAAWVSYWHMAGVAQRYGEATGAAHLLPLSVDGLIVVASVCLVELGGRDRTPAAQEPLVFYLGPVYDHYRPIGPMPAPVKLAVERPSGTGGDGDSAGQRARQDPRSEQDREAAVCAMRQAAPEATLRQISTATLVPVSTVRNILNRAAAQNERAQEMKVNGKVPDLEGAK
jgi:hypothetical protein